MNAKTLPFQWTNMVPTIRESRFISWLYEAVHQLSCSLYPRLYRLIWCNANYMKPNISRNNELVVDSNLPNVNAPARKLNYDYLDV